MRKMPKGMKYWYIDKNTEQWKIKDDAPVWARREFEEFQKAINPEQNKEGIVTQY